MNHVASSNPFEPESSFLQFGTWSVLLHVGILLLLSFLHFSHDVEQTKPMVKVTLIETPAPEPAQKEPGPQAPPMLQPQRQTRPLASKPIPPPPEPLNVPPEPVEIAEVVAPPPQQPPPEPLKRRILQDQRATDTLKLRELTKVAKRSTPTTTTTKVRHSINIPVLSTIAAIKGVSTRRLMPTSSPSTPFRDSNAKIRTLRAMGDKVPSTAKVGLGRTIPPLYPRIAKKSGWEGTVLVRVTVQPNGKAGEVTVRRSSGYEILDKAAIDAVKKWSFHPEKDGNIPIRSVVEIPIKFSLNKQS